MSEAENLRLLDYLQHIRDAILRIGRYVKGLDEPRFFTDDKTQDAVIRNLEIIGEASNKVASRFPEFTAQHPEIPWSLAYEMRNAVSHGYFKVDLAIVWKTIQNDLPQLDKQVANLLPKQPRPPVSRPH